MVSSWFVLCVVATILHHWEIKYCWMKKLAQKHKRWSTTRLSFNQFDERQNFEGSYILRQRKSLVPFKNVMMTLLDLRKKCPYKFGLPNNLHTRIKSKERDNWVRRGFFVILLEVSLALRPVKYTKIDLRGLLKSKPQLKIGESHTICILGFIK